jgi:hypothetical protein
MCALVDGGYNGGWCTPKIVVKGHGVKGRQHKTKLEALGNPTMLVDVGWQIIPQPWSYTLCLHYVRYATSIRSDHFFNMKPIEKIILLDLQVPWMNMWRWAC